MSLGVQSLQENELKFLGREHSADEARHAIALAANYFSRYSFDLIYARPHQTVAAWERELEEALSFAGDHLSLYQLTIEENTAFHHAYKKGGFTLPDEQESEALYRATEARMAACGLMAYEVSNYAKAGQESRHNLAYWQGSDYIGVGPGAHGRLTKNGTRIATTTLKSPERWIEAVERNGHAVDIWQHIDRQQEAEERLMMGLRLREGIGYREFEVNTGFDLRDYLNAQKLALYQAKGLLEKDGERLRTTLNGRLVLGTLTGELLL